MFLYILLGFCNCPLVVHMWRFPFPSVEWLRGKCSQARVKSWAVSEWNGWCFKQHREVETLLRNNLLSPSNAGVFSTKYFFFFFYIWIRRKLYLMVKPSKAQLCFTRGKTCANPTVTETITSWWITLLPTNDILNPEGQVLCTQWSFKHKLIILLNLSLCRWKKD